MLIALGIGLLLAMRVAGSFDAGARPGANANMSDLSPQFIIRRSFL
jgi:hypothetical protein